MRFGIPIGLGGLTMSRAIVASFDAVGGPSKISKEPDGYWAGPTDAGNYRVSHCGKHSSPSYPDWSKIRWGSEIKEVGGELQVMHDGKWQALKVLSPRVTKQDIKQRNLDLYGKYEVPKSWVFNDFGHMTCYFFKDLNRNKRFDRKTETIHKEYFHTTPDDEASAEAGKPITLTKSHGCIHIKPKDIDAMIKAGYFAGGNRVVVHRYDEKLPAWTGDPGAGAPFEVHFFPGAHKVVVTGRSKPAKKP
jgi:hypothetical protein